MGIIVIFDKYNRNVFCSAMDKVVNVFLWHLVSVLHLN